MSLTEKLIPNYAELAKTMTAIEIAQIHEMNPDTVRRFLHRKGVEPVRYCRKCGFNRPAEDFEKKTHRSCSLHERGEDGRNPDRGCEAIWEAALWKEIRETQALISCWQANASMKGYAGSLGALEWE